MAMEKVFEKKLSGNFLSILFVLIFFSAYSNAAEIHVYPQSQARQTLDDGSQVSTLGTYIQFPDLQTAIDIAADGDTICIWPGIYKGHRNRDLDFNGKAITFSGINPNDPNIVAATIIDCNGTQADPHRGFYFHSGEDSNSVVCGITITNGWQEYGGAIYCYQSSPYIHHCNLVSNSSSFGGSAICYNRANVKIEDCVIEDNKYTAAVWDASSRIASNLYMKNCIVKNTFMVTGNYGGIRGGYGKIEIENCTIEGNENYAIFGGYVNARLEIRNCIIRKNGSGVEGTSNSLIENSTIIENLGFGLRRCAIITDSFIACNGGNGLEYCGKTVNCKIIANNGNGIYDPFDSFLNYDGDKSIINCIITKNKKRGIYFHFNYTSMLTNCTIVDNNSAGVEIYSSYPNITNCIIRDNFGEQIKGATSSTKITYTNSYKADTSKNYPANMPFSGIGNINQEPDFVSEKDYHLLPGSPCIDAGTNDANFVTEANDIEGNPRIIDGDSNGIETADMGAYEYNPDEPVIAAWADRIVCLKNAGNQMRGKLYIKNAGSGALNYEIVSENDWLTIDNPAGSSAGEIQDINLAINADNLELGDYYCRVKIYSDDAVNSGHELWLQVHIGTLWTVPVDANTIQDAIDAANNFDYVCVMDGNYFGPGNRDIIFGAKNLVLYSESGNPENCIIDCQGFPDGLIFNSHETEAILDGFTIINASNNAVVCDVCSSPIIINCNIRKSMYGLYIRNYCSPKITDCNFKDCSGYGMRSDYSFSFKKIAVSNCIFSSVNSGMGFYHGGILSIKNCNMSLCGISLDTIREAILENVNMFQGGISLVNCGKLSLNNCDINSSNRLAGLDCHYDIEEVSIRNSNISNCRMFGIQLFAKKFQIINTNIINNGRSRGAGMHLNTPIDGAGEVINCLISGNGPLPKMNGPYAGISISGNVNVKNCLITANTNGYYTSRNAQINFENCTFANNLFNTMWTSSYPKINFLNCILSDENLIYQRESGAEIDISYSNVHGGWDGYGIGNIDTDPCFVRPGYWDPNQTPSDANDDFWVQGDYHLKSYGWRWDSDENDWTYDRESSRCIDAGCPGTALGDELLFVPDDPYNEYCGQNLRIDMGYYGGTAEASMPPFDWAILGDMDNSGRVNLADYSYLSDFYGLQGEKLDGDLNRDGLVDLNDIMLLAADWLKKTYWSPRI